MDKTDIRAMSFRVANAILGSVGLPCSNWQASSSPASHLTDRIGCWRCWASFGHLLMAMLQGHLLGISGLCGCVNYSNLLDVEPPQSFNPSRSRK